MEHLGLIESDIAHVIDELCSENHRKDVRGLFSEFCEYDESFECGSDRPTGHEREFFSGFVTGFESFDVTWLHGRAISDMIDVLHLIVEHDDLVPCSEVIEESEYIIVFTFDPWIVR